MPIFDTITYIQAAFCGDAWFMNDIIGIYRSNHESLTLVYKTKDPRRETMHNENVKENFKRWKIIEDKLCKAIGKQEAQKYYIKTMFGLIDYYAKARPAFKNRLYYIFLILKTSGFMPRLWIKIPFITLIHFLRKITPLRNLYRKIKRT